MLSALRAFVVYFFLTTKNTTDHKEKMFSALRGLFLFNH